MKQDVSNSEFGLTKSKITPINQAKTPKKLIDVAHSKDINSVSLESIALARLLYIVILLRIGWK